jgi:hypothetical protein
MQIHLLNRTSGRPMLGITSEYVIRSARAPQFSALRFVGPAFVTAAHDQNRCKI